MAAGKSSKVKQPEKRKQDKSKKAQRPVQRPATKKQPAKKSAPKKQPARGAKKNAAPQKRKASETKSKAKTKPAPKQRKVEAKTKNPGWTVKINVQTPEEEGEEEVDESEDDAVDGQRMASDKKSGVHFCASVAEAREAWAKGVRRLEFGGLAVSESDEALDFICGKLMAYSTSSSSGKGTAGEAENEKLEGISFAGCHLTAAHLRKLAAELKASGASSALTARSGDTQEYLEQLDNAHGLSMFGISNNPGIEVEAWRELFVALPADATWLDFGDNGLTDDCIVSLIAGLPGRDKLDKLYLDGNKLQDISGLCGVLPDCSVTELDLGDNNLQDEGIQALANVLSRSVLCILVLGKNPISSEGARQLADVISQSPLDTLYLNETGADDEFLKTLSNTLKESKLTELHLDHTKITDAGVLALVPQLESSELSYLDIDGNTVSSKTIKLASGALQAGMDRRRGAAAREAQTG